MTLSEALRILNGAPPAAHGSVRFRLVCGFTPLHLKTFLAAELQRRSAERRVEIETGLYGDLLGSLEAAAEPADGVAVVLEWADLDPRLGVRDLGGWRPVDVTDALASATRRAGELEAAIASVGAATRVVVALPSLPVPPCTHPPGWMLDSASATLRRITADLGAALAARPGVVVLDPQHLDQRSPAAERVDAKAWLATGFPYRTPHAAVLGELLATALRPPAPKKGIITDLDETLWRGILGEEGPEGIFWDLEHHAHAHGLYQQLLHALAVAGVLVAVASKADGDVVAQGLAAPGLLLPRDRIFPVEASWGLKSEAVRRILAAWNVGPESVVFVDDSAAELAEVAGVHPTIECLRFPSGDDQGIYAFLERLRDLCGKARVSAEDELRLASLRSAVSVQTAAAEGPARQDAFLAAAGQELTALAVAGDTRPLELVNKTNQFNLNGRRWSEREWHALLARPDALALCFAYRDKYGPLGKIATVAGRRAGRTLHLDAWVLSCRAFSRRIEHAILECLFERWELDEIVLAYQPTPRNHLVRDFLAALLGAAPAAGSVGLARAAFAVRRPALYTQLVLEAA